MKKLILGLAAIIACSTANAQKKIEEGSIVYTVEWKLPPTAPPQMAAMMPNELTTFFKGDSSATQSKSSMSSSNTIMNVKTDFVQLLLDIPMANKKFSVKFTPADLEQMEDQMPKFEYTPSNETKSIAGYKAQKYSVKETKSGQTFDAYFTKDVDLTQNSLTRFYDKTLGVPLQFTSFQNGMGVTAVVKDLKPGAVPSGSFSGTKDYEEITFDQLKAMMPK